MNGTHLLATKYATAYLNLFDKDVDLSTCKQFIACAQFFNTHSPAMLVLKLSIISREDKRACALKALDAFGLPKTTDRIVDLLLEQNRLMLLPEIFMHIDTQYKKRHNIETFNVASAESLDKEQVNIIIDFLKYMTNKQILYNVKKNQKLIAGIRLQSDTTLWEYSINKQLHTLEQQFMIKG